MSETKQPKVALYDLGSMPTTFDFAVYAVVAKTLGCDSVHFAVTGMANWKYSPEIGWRRWANICIPLCRLAGLTFTVGSQAEGEMYWYDTGLVERVYKKQGRIEKLKSVVEYPKSGYVTITMRESFRNKWRDSNRPEWAKVAEYLLRRGEEVLVLEECESQPLALEERMAIYSNAKMNLAVGNGPMVLCWLSEAPYLTFQLPRGPKQDHKDLVEQWARLKFPVGSQLSFRNSMQEIVWGPDDADLIIEKYEKLVGKPKPNTQADSGLSKSGD